MAVTIAETVRRFKADVARCLEPGVIEKICRALEYQWRERVLDPVTTIHLFLWQVLNGNTACSALPHWAEHSFTGSAYCAARQRLPQALFRRLLEQVCSALQQTIADAGRWRGHRTWLIDGSSFSMPDTPALQAHFGQPGAQAAGCGFPVAHWLALFHAETGLLLRVTTAPLRTHDLAQAAEVHDAMAEGDVLVADRGFVSYAHLALISRGKMHAVFRVHQKQIVSFRPGRFSVPPRPCGLDIKGLPRSRWLKRLGGHDQLVEYPKPKQKPAWMSAAEYAALPETIQVRELRYTVPAGRRTRQITLVTTLLDPIAYPAEALATLYGERWQVETNFRHLKQTMGMDVLHCKSVDGVLKELHVFALAYNLVRIVMIEAARQSEVAVDRISFLDALRWIRTRPPGAPLTLLINPLRPNRLEPRVRKRRPKQYPLMTKPRAELRKALLAQS